MGGISGSTFEGEDVEQPVQGRPLPIFLYPGKHVELQDCRPVSATGIVESWDNDVISMGDSFGRQGVR